MQVTGSWFSKLCGIEMLLCPLRDCVALNQNKTDHCKAREQCGRPAGGLQLGPAQVQLPPGQGLH